MTWNEKITDFLHDNFALCFCLTFALLIVAVFFYGRSCGIDEAERNNIKGTIQQTKRDIDEAGANINKAKMENDSARNSINRASQTVGEMRKRVDRSQAELREANRLIDECLQYNYQLKKGLEDIRRTNQAH